MEINIKKVLKTIYKFDFTKLPPIISHGSEFFVSDNGISEFNQTFKKQDLDNGIVVTVKRKVKPEGAKRPKLEDCDETYLFADLISVSYAINFK